MQSLPRKQAMADITTITARTIKTVPKDPLEWDDEDDNNDDGGGLVTVLG